jgi:HK97 family phage major capsid protein
MELKEELEGLKSEIKSHVDTKTAEAVKGANEKTESLETELKASKEELQKQFDLLSAKVAKGQTDKAGAKSLVQVVEENIEGIKGSVGKKGHDFEFEVKADTLRASVENNPNAHDIAEVGQLAHRKLTLYDLFPKVPVGSGANGVVRYTDWDEATKVRAAAMVAEGAAFPSSTAKWKTYTLALQKIGDSIPFSEELAYDAPRFASELRLFLDTNVSIIRDTQLYSGDNTGNNLKGIVTSVDAFVPAASGISDASIYDLLVKVSESITKTGGNKYQPNFALMNITDINAMRLKKDANENYVIPPFANADGSIVAGMVVIECNAVTANTAIVGDSRYARIYEVPGFVVSSGYATGDFEEDMQTLKARTRLNLLIRTADKGGFAKVTSISAALTTLAT